MTAAPLDERIVSAVETVGSGVVGIHVTGRRGAFGSRARAGEAAGTGIALNGGGLILTNSHVVDQAREIRVRFPDGSDGAGSLLGRDRATDLALLRASPPAAASIRLGDSEALRVGQFVLAVGHSLDLPGGPTVSLGVIGALHRPLPGSDFVFEGLIQTDAAINPGNSGGPLADLDGRVIGVNAAMIPFAQGIGFAIPSNTIRLVVDQLLRLGRVVRPWLGISGVGVSAVMARQHRLPAESGVLVVEVASASPAERAGIQSGDLLVQVGPHSTPRLRDLLQTLSSLPIGSQVAVVYLRGKTAFRGTLQIAEAPRSLAA